MGMPDVRQTSILAVYLIRLRKRPRRCRGFEEGVREKIPFCGTRDLYESAGQRVTEGIQQGCASRQGKLLQLRGGARMRTLSALKRLNTTELRRDAGRRRCKSLLAHTQQ